MKPIRLSRHAKEHQSLRGFTVAQVERAIRGADWKTTRSDRLQCRMDFPYDRDWYGKRYSTIQVRPVFVEEEGEIVVITVYTYFF